MERVLKLLLAYEGTHFHGWQEQPELRTVQATVADTLRRVLQHPVNLLAASRTDAGVHALGQVASCRTSSHIEAEKLFCAVAYRLPDDIGLRALRDAAADFHPIRAAQAKTYVYTIHSDPGRPVEILARGFRWHVWTPLKLDRMEQAAERLIGTHDFAAFMSAGSQPRRTTVRTIHSIVIARRETALTLEFTGDGFLYNQVRNMVGTLVEIGRGHWPVERMTRILESRNRRDAGPTAPPQGLCLQRVHYAQADAPAGLEMVENGAC